MKPRSRDLIRLAPLVLGALCACTANKTEGLGVAIVGFDGQSYTAKEMNLDLGLVRVGATVEKKLVITNGGAADIRVEILSHSGDAEFAVTPDSGSWVISPPMQTDAGLVNRAVELQVEFHAAREAAFSTDLHLKVGNSNGSPDLFLHLTAETVASCGAIAIEPAPLIFNDSVPDATTSGTLTLENTNDRPVKVRVGAIQGETGTFAFHDGPVVGTMIVPAGSTENPGKLAFTVDFTPAIYGEYSASVTVTTPIGCDDPPVTVQIRGNCPDKQITCDSNVDVGGYTVCALDFGMVHPALSVSNKVKIKNGSDKKITFRAGTIDGAGKQFEVVDPKENAEDPGKDFTVEVKFTPDAHGEISAHLVMATDDENRPTIQVLLKGTGSGPVLEVDDSLAFGEVAAKTYQYRTLIIRNAAPLNEPSGERLRFGTVADDGTFTGKPPALTEGSDEFRLEWPPQADAIDPDTEAPFDPAVGLAPGERLAVRVLFLPMRTSEATATLTVYTTDPVNSERKVTLTGTGRDFIECALSVDPAALDFGEVAPTETKALTFTIKNLGGANTDCLISNFAMSFRTTTQKQGTFTFKDAPGESFELKGGESRDITVSFEPRLAGTATGEVSFYRSSSAPTVTIPMSGSMTLEGNCVGVAPVQVDFDRGPKDWCSGAVTKTVTLFNACPETAVKVTGVRIGSRAPFALVSGQTLSGVVESGGTFAVQVRHDGTNADASEQLVFDLDDGDIREAMLVRSDSLVETYSQAPLPKENILFVVDIEGTDIATLKAQVDSKLVAMFSALDPTKLDYRVAVITGASRLEDAGLFIASQDGTRVIAAGEAGAQTHFQEKLAAATSGDTTPWLLPPAQRALESDRVCDGCPNVGLHADAPLRLVFATNAMDSDVLPISGYSTFFGAVSNNRWSVAAAIPMTLTNPTCTYEPATAAQSDRISTLAMYGHGKSIDVCADDWSALQPVVQASYAPQTVFPLQQKALAKPEVTVNGVRWGGEETGKRWTWNAKAPRQIEFIDVPPPDAKIGVTYTVSCAK